MQNLGTQARSNGSEVAFSQGLSVICVRIGTKQHGSRQTTESVDCYPQPTHIPGPDSLSSARRSASPSLPFFPSCYVSSWCHFLQQTRGGNIFSERQAPAPTFHLGGLRPVSQERAEGYLPDPHVAQASLWLSRRSAGPVSDVGSREAKPSRWVITTHQADSVDGKLWSGMSDCS